MLNRRPATTRFVDPRAAQDDVAHDYSLEVANEAGRNYMQWIADRCAPHLGRRVLEVGAGHGAVTARIAPGREVVAVDLSENCVRVMRERFADAPNVEVFLGDAHDAGAGSRFDSILMVNVLEHIVDDVGVLQSLATRLEPGGRIVIYVPALDALYSRYDRMVGHQRRYTKARLRAVAAETGFDVLELRYANLVSLPAWFLVAKVLKKDPAEGDGLAWWDRFVIPASRLVEDRVPIPLGSNLFMVLQPPPR